MKIKFLGTSAAEGTPAVFCECEVCEAARKLGGRNIRSRSQALIDGALLVDLPADTYYHALRYGISLVKIENCIVTHSHNDHFYPAELIYRYKWFCNLKNESALTVYGTKAVCDKLANDADYREFQSDRTFMREIRAFEPFYAGDYHIIPLEANHDKRTGPVIYVISRAGRSILYANDTAYFPDETWDYLETNKILIDLAELDCTFAESPGLCVSPGSGHMNLETDIKVRERLIKIGCCNDNAPFYLNHFSHNGAGALYDDFSKTAARHGFLVTYDGLEAEV